MAKYKRRIEYRINQNVLLQAQQPPAKTPGPTIISPNTVSNLQNRLQSNARL